MENKLALIIPTYNKPIPLLRLLESINHQTIPPHQVIISDASRPPLLPVWGILESQGLNIPLTIDYTWTKSPGLTRQKNQGKSKLRPEITLVGYLDDDTILYEDAVEKMLEFWFWQGAPDAVGGAAFNIIDNSVSKLSPLSKLFNRVFLIGNKPGQVEKSGDSLPLFNATEDTTVQRLSGGAAVWRRQVVDKYWFDEHIDGNGYVEDIDYSLRVRKEYRLWVVAKARVRHLQQTSSKPAGQVNKQRRYLAKKHKEISRLCLEWSLLGRWIAGLKFY